MHFRKIGIVVNVMTRGASAFDEKDLRKCRTPVKQLSHPSMLLLELRSQGHALITHMGHLKGPHMPCVVTEEA